MVLVGKPEGKRPLEDLGSGGRIILQEVLGRTNRLISFVTTWATQKRKIRGDTRTHRQQVDLITFLLFFKIRKVG
jgi:hypothetical protein